MVIGMNEAEKRSETTQTEAPRESQTQPKLPASFFQNLLNPPLCKVTGECDGCGRCEH